MIPTTKLNCFNFSYMTVKEFCKRQVKDGIFTNSDKVQLENMNGNEVVMMIDKGNGDKEVEEWEKLVDI